MSQKIVYHCDMCGKEIVSHDELYVVSVGQYVINERGCVQVCSSKRRELCSDCAKSAVSTDCLRDDKDAEEA